MFLSISQHCCLEIGIGIEKCTEIIIVMRKLSTHHTGHRIDV